MRLPVDVRDLVKSGARLAAERAEAVHVAVFVELDAPDALVSAVEEALRPETASAKVSVEVAEPGRGDAPLAPGCDVLLAIAGSGGPALAAGLVGGRAARIPVAVAALGDEKRAEELAAALLQPRSDVLVMPEASGVVGRFADWLVDACASKRLALAHNFAFVRRAVAEDAVRTTAWQNAVIGAVAFVPGADMPVMTANQAKMLLQIAAAYGQPLGADRVKELAAVVGGGFAFRAIARQAIGVVPVLGWAVKGGVAYSGTVAMGRAAIRYFEDGADLGRVLARFRELGSSATRRARTSAGVSQPGEGQLALPIAPEEASGA